MTSGLTTAWMDDRILPPGALGWCPTRRAARRDAESHEPPEPKLPVVRERPWQG